MTVLKGESVPVETVFQRVVISNTSSQINIEGSYLMSVVYGARAYKFDTSKSNVFWIQIWDKCQEYDLKHCWSLLWG